MLQDLSYTLRHWARRPWHTGFTILALAIGIGANTGVFSVVNALLLRSLPFREPDRLALLHQFISRRQHLTIANAAHCSCVEPPRRSSRLLAE